MEDFGFIAEDASRLFPELATYVGRRDNDQGNQVRKNSHSSTEAVKEQQGMIIQQQTVNNEQSMAIAGMNLKTSQNVETVSELQKTVDDNLALVGAKINEQSQSLALGAASSQTLSAKDDGLEAKITAAQTRLTEAENNLVTF